jgi:fructuronate reductase
MSHLSPAVLNPSPSPRLSEATLPALPRDVARPAYDRAATRIGIVHLGAGAFHRAHQAAYIDELLADQPDWAICAVSLRNPDVRDALRPQDGLYALAEIGERPRLRVIGAIRELLCARDERDAVLARLADPAVRLVTLTVTEKGYCLGADGLDFGHPDIVHDLASPEAPASAIGLVVAGLRARHARGIAPYTVRSCARTLDRERGRLPALDGGQHHAGHRRRAARARRRAAGLPRCLAGAT